VFGQKKICGEELRSIIVINSTRKSLKEFVHSISNINPTLKDIAKTLNIEIDGTNKAITEPDQALSLTANIISIATSDYNTTLDFYNISPTSMKSAGSSGKVGIDPIVRVELSTSIFIGLFDSIANCLTDSTTVNGE
jgi:hypothetical protein